MSMGSFNKNTLKRDWTNKDTLRLIEDYSKAQILWQSTSIDGFSDTDQKTDLIAGLAEKYQCHPKEVVRRLHSLRTQMCQEINRNRRRNSTCSVDDCVSTWPYFSYLKFLFPILSQEDRFDDMDDYSGDGDDFPGRELVGRKPRKRDSYGDVAAKALLMMQGQDDEHDDFGNYVAMELRELSCNKLRQRLKLGIRRLIVETIELQDEELYADNTPMNT